MLQIKEHRERRREHGLKVELDLMGNEFAKHFETIVGKNADHLEGFSPKQVYQFCGIEKRAKNGVAINWAGVGVFEREEGELLPCLILKRVNDEGSPFFYKKEPIKYRVVYKRTGEGLRFLAVDRRVKDKKKKKWEECDLTTSFVILETIGDLADWLVEKHTELVR